MTPRLGDDPVERLVDGFGDALRMMDLFLLHTERSLVQVLAGRAGAMRPQVLRTLLSTLVGARLHLRVTVRTFEGLLGEQRAAMPEDVRARLRRILLRTEVLELELGRAAAGDEPRRPS